MPKKEILHLPQLWLERWRNSDPFWQIFHLQGETYREQPGRRTFRFVEANEPYFIKCHYGVGWREIIKNIVQGRLPILGAYNEYAAIQRLTALNFVPAIVGFGIRGKNPAKQQSFLITKELSFTVSLEDFCRDWPIKKPSIALKRALIRHVAEIARKMHDAGVNHRDFYLCHFLLDKMGGKELLDKNAINLYLIDLHRAQLRNRVPFRWRVKDIAGLYFSAMDIGLTSNDLRCFALTYNRGKNDFFWQSVQKRAVQLYRKIWRRFPRDLHFPFYLPLEASSFLHAKQCMRCLPKKRIVVQGEWQDKIVLAKLFAKQRHALAEINGYQQLQQHGFATPLLYHHGWSKYHAVYVVIYEYMRHTQTFSEIFEQADNTQKKLWLDKLLNLIECQHQAGIWQDDLHFNNFLVKDDKLLTIDLASIHANKTALSPKQRTANLAQLFAQLPQHLAHLIGQHYTPMLQQAILAAQHKRVKKYLAKTQRNCSAFKHKRLGKYDIILDRNFDTVEMQVMIDHIIRQKSTTHEAIINNHVCRVTTYKSSLKHLFLSQARQLWLKMHKQCFSEQKKFPTAIALLEKKWLCFKTKSYIIIAE